MTLLQCVASSEENRGFLLKKRGLLIKEVYSY